MCMCICKQIMRMIKREVKEEEEEEEEEEEVIDSHVLYLVKQCHFSIVAMLACFS